MDRLLESSPLPAPPDLGAPSPAGRDAAPTAAGRRRAVQRERIEALTLWWLDLMVTVENPLPEKVTLFWHGHFATSIRKVRDPELMFGQNQTLRRLGLGSFTALTAAGGPGRFGSLAFV